MFRFLAAIVAALARLGVGIVQWSWQIVRPFLPWNWFGSHSASAPPRNLAAILPDANEAKETKEQARGQQRTVELMMDHPARQIKMWITGDRASTPLDKLSVEQRLWLEDLSETQLLLLKDAPDRKIFDALTGRPDAIPGVVSFGCQPAKLSPVAERIIAFRAGELGRSPAAVVH